MRVRMRHFLTDSSTSFERRLVVFASVPAQFPDIGGARRALLHRFSHAVYFLLPDDEHAIVIAILHQR